MPFRKGNFFHFKIVLLPSSKMCIYENKFRKQLLWCHGGKRFRRCFNSETLFSDFAIFPCAHAIDILLKMGGKSVAYCIFKPFTFFSTSIINFFLSLRFILMLAKISNTDIYFSYFWKNGSRGMLKKIEYILDIKTNIAPLPVMCIYPRKTMVWHATLIQSLKL